MDFKRFTTTGQPEPIDMMDNEVIIHAVEQNIYLYPSVDLALGSLVENFGFTPLEDTDFDLEDCKKICCN